MGYPTIYPTGTTVYEPEKCWNGYTIIHALETGALLLDMNGNEVKMWKGLHGMPHKILPGGYVMGHSGLRNPKYGFLEHVDVVQVDWDGKVVWKFDEWDLVGNGLACWQILDGKQSAMVREQLAVQQK